MSVFSAIAGAEPSTITFKAATVTQTRNSSVMHQELVTLADPESSLAIMAIRNATPASTAWGIVVRPLFSSTAADTPVRAVFSSTAADNPVVVSGNSTVVVSAFAAGLISSAAPAGNSSALVVRVAGGPSSAADLLMRPVFSSTNTDNPVRAVLSSTAADNPVVVSGNSTVVVSGFAAGLISTGQPAAGSSGLNVWAVGGILSSVAGRVGTMPFSTVWASSAGFHFDSSGALQVAASFTGSTGPLTISQLLDSSGGSITAADSANNAVRVSIAAGTVGFNLGTLQSSAAPAGNSSALLVRIAGGPSSAADCAINVSSVAGIVAVRPSDTNWASSAGFHFNSSGELLSVASLTGSTIVTVSAFGAGLLSSAAVGANSSALNVRVVGHGSSAVDFPVRAVLSSTAADNPVIISGNSTVVVSAFAAGLLSSAAAAGNSSALNVRIVGGASSAADCLVRPVFSSTNADNPVRAVLSSTAADNPVVATIGTNLQSSVAGSSNSSALLVRPIIDNILTVASTNAFASTSFTVQSSGAALRTYVTAYSITSTNSAAKRIAFYSSGTMVWPIVLQAVSSAMSGANLAVSAPAYLFRGTASEAMTVQVASSLAGYMVAVSYFRAP